MQRKIVLAVMIIVTFLLQSTLFQWLSIASSVPNLLLILTVSFGFMRGKKEGIMVGFFCGLITDLFFGNLFGFSALVYMYIGYLNGFFCKVFYDDDIKVPMLLVAVSDIAYGVTVYVLQFLLRGRLQMFSYVRHVMFPELIYTVVLTMIFYRIFFKINRILVANEMEGQKSLWLRK